MSAPRPGFVHPTAVIGAPPEHREWSEGQPFFLPHIHDTAQINAFVTVDAGLHEPTTIGARTFLMAHVHVGHDTRIAADCELAPHCSVGGHVTIGNRVRVGLGAIFRPFVTVGDGARIGAGAVVVKDVPAGEVWAGNPARPLRQPYTGPVMNDLEERGWDELAVAYA